ncbi:MAG: Oleate hydroxylase fah12 [Sarea resinae]|nr:MAG: Oleate hydroxylase fah12 [Sarea resinae]
MATTTALPKKTVLQRSITTESVPSSSTPSVSVSPIDSPTHSASSTSLSSLASADDLEVKPRRGRLLDTYGNEFEIPDFTIKQIRDAIPAHCFNRSAVRGLLYVARDLLYLATTFYVFHNFVTPEYIASKPVRAGLWAVYTVLQGLFGTGIWVLAHECGHQAFSSSKVLNDTVGWVLHSSLLVPYFSWKISHGKHHKATGHLERDMVFVPKTRQQYANRVGVLVHEVSELMEETPIATAIHMFSQQIGGWIMYLSTNVTGHNFHERQREGRGKGKSNGYFGGVNHFNPHSPLYEAKDEKLILLSDLGLAIMGGILFLLGQKFGWSNMAVWYFVPYLWVNHWLVAITYLQHTDPSLPHYEADTWTFTRGAAATIDREFGFIGRSLMHGIIETHVLHHYISTIPFYHADEASAAIQPVMGKHYRADVEGGSIGFLRSMWKSARMCQWIEPSAEAQGEGRGVLFFRNHNGLGVPPIKMTKGQTSVLEAIPESPVAAAVAAKSPVGKKVEVAA